MEEKPTELNSELLLWIKDNAERFGECQIILSVRKGRVMRAACYMSSEYKEADNEFNRT